MSRKHLLNHCDTLLLFCSIATVPVVRGIEDGPDSCKATPPDAIFDPTKCGW